MLGGDRGGAVLPEAVSPDMEREQPELITSLSFSSLICKVGGHDNAFLRGLL